MSSARLSLIFSSIGHFYIHMFTAFYAVVVVTMAEQAVWHMSYDELLRLWTLGAMLIGLGAIPAGRFGDKWSAPAMMTAFFIGMGVSAIASALAGGPIALTAALAGIGAFASIYHPVGIPWLIRNAGAGRVGKVLAFNGIFGSFGTAGAGLIAGLLLDFSGWRVAFIVPGAISVVTGFVMLWLLLRGRLRETPVARATESSPDRADMLRVFLILLVSMFIGGVIYHVMQTALPKLFSERLGGLLGDRAIGVGGVFALVFILGGIMQIVGGYLADRFPLKIIYATCWFLQTFVLAAIAVTTNIGVIGFAAMAVMINVASLPAENMMLARYTPEHRHGMAFGVKFVLAFVSAPVAIELIAWIKAATGEFVWLFAGLAVATALVFLLLLALPRERGARARRTALAAE